MLIKLKKYSLAIFGLILLIGAVKLFSFSGYQESDDDAYLKYFHQNYKIFSLNIPENLNFSNEKVPIHDFDVRERLDRELLINTYWQSQTLLLHKRANRWFPMIEPILKRNGIPDDFKYLALIESGLTNVVSPAGATGFWQILEPTAKSYGLEVSEEVDERYNVEKSTEAACKYLKEAYKEFGNWTLAAASYNMGISGITRQIARQKVKNYYDLLLNEETARYLFRILSIKEIITNPKNYGFHIRKKDLYPPIPVTYVSIDSSISDLADFALEQNVNYKLLKLLNPWLRQSNLSNKEKKKYRIAFPRASNQNIYEKLLIDSESSEDITVSSDSLTRIDSLNTNALKNQ